MKVKAEYIWIDGYEPTANLRSKTKVLDGAVSSVSELPTWGFDGSSTLQADGGDSDCLLKPVWMCPDPIRGGENILVMNEVCNPDGKPHRSNSRAALVGIAEKFKEHKPWFGIEQEYTLMDGKQPAGWPEEGPGGRPVGGIRAHLGDRDREDGHPGGRSGDVRRRAVYGPREVGRRSGRRRAGPVRRIGEAGQRPGPDGPGRHRRRLGRRRLAGPGRVRPDRRLPTRGLSPPVACLPCSCWSPSSRPCRGSASSSLCCCTVGREVACRTCSAGASVPRPQAQPWWSRTWIGSPC